MRTRASAALFVCLLAVLPTAGCYQGFDETVNNQPPTGNGTDFAVGQDLKVQDTTLVADPEGGRASLVMTIVNEGEADEALTSVVVPDSTTVTTSGPIAVKSGAAVKVGGDSENQVVVTGLKVPAGSYARVTLGFATAGSASESIAVVPAAGYYEEYAPAPEASPSATATATATP